MDRSPASAAPRPCLIPAGHASAETTAPAGRVSLQVTFVQPCDLSVRVSGVDLTIHGAFAGVAFGRIRSRAPVTAPVVIYDAAVDRPTGAAFTKQLDASSPMPLDELHAVICAGEATFELIDATGATVVKTPVTPSNTGKC